MRAAGPGDANPGNAKDGREDLPKASKEAVEGGAVHTRRRYRTSWEALEVRRTSDEERARARARS
jgi:hypothetical protein